MQQIYIDENTDLSMLENREVGDVIQFKFEDSTLVFTSDGSFIYIHDIDDPDEADLLRVNVGLTAQFIIRLFHDHNGEEYGNKQIEILSKTNLFFADSFINNDIHVKEVYAAINK